MSAMYALDFDGVICDSCGESARSALIAAKKKWPHVFEDEDRWREIPEWLLDQMRVVRPVVETGYENMLLLRLLVEERLESEKAEPAATMSTDDILLNWKSMKADCLERFEITQEELVEDFGSVRDAWMERDLEGWLNANAFYPGVVNAINSATSPVFIITTKQTRFAKALLDHAGVVNVPEENIFGWGSGSKVSVIKKLLRRPELKGRTVYFVEDRLETLEGAELSLLGAPITYCLANWGYNTKEERARAADDPQITILELPDFEAKMQ